MGAATPSGRSPSGPPVEPLPRLPGLPLGGEMRRILPVPLAALDVCITASETSALIDLLMQADKAGWAHLKVDMWALAGAHDLSERQAHAMVRDLETAGVLERITVQPHEVVLHVPDPRVDA